MDSDFAGLLMVDQVGANLTTVAKNSGVAAGRYHAR